MHAILIVLGIIGSLAAIYVIAALLDLATGGWRHK